MPGALAKVALILSHSVFGGLFPPNARVNHEPPIIREEGL
ncbi:hypothetical protein N234_36255 [Ralstonia pickettii DTP0602]|nr:hypothetical protein N234_36255 [Ralstonia pickettii DTP0602]